MLQVRLHKWWRCRLSSKSECGKKSTPNSCQIHALFHACFPHPFHGSTTGAQRGGKKREHNGSTAGTPQGLTGANLIVAGPAGPARCVVPTSHREPPIVFAAGGSNPDPCWAVGVSLRGIERGTCGHWSLDFLWALTPALEQRGF